MKYCEYKQKPVTNTHKLLCAVHPGIKWNDLKAAEMQESQAYQCEGKKNGGTHLTAAFLAASLFPSHLP